ncbi:MAG TPA: flippase [Anaerolineales bacterium]|nr:flippase [Anaerolineales bacterium]
MVEQPENLITSKAARASSFERNLVGVAKGGGITLAGKMFNNAIRLVTAFLLARLLGAEQYGMYQLSLNVITLVAGIVLLGFDRALTRFMAISVARRDDNKTWGILQLGIGIPLLLSVLTNIGLFLLAYPVAEQLFHDIRMAPLIQIVSIFASFSALSDVLIGAVRGFKNMQYPVIAKFMVQPVVKLILVGVSALLGLQVWHAVIIFGIGELVTAGLLLYFLNQLFSLRRPIGSGQRNLREMVAYAIPDWLAGLLTTFRINIQALLIGTLGTIAGVGIFAVADQLNKIGHDFYTSINTSADPYIAELHDSGKTKELGHLYQTATKWSLTINLPFFLTFMLFSEQILSIFGKSFVGGATALIILAWANLVDVGTGMCGTILSMTGHTRLKLVNNIVSISLSIGLNVLLIPRFGIVGAAVSALLVYIALNSIRILQVYYLMRLTPYNRTFLKPIAAALVAFGVIFALKTWLPVGENILFVAAYAFTLLGIFAGMIWLMGLSSEDRMLLDRVMQKTVKRFKGR